MTIISVSYNAHGDVIYYYLLVTCVLFMFFVCGDSRIYSIDEIGRGQ